MKYYYDRTAPLLIVAEPSFDAVPVEIEEGFGGFIVGLGNILQEMEQLTSTEGSPEDSGQRLAELFQDKISDLIEDLS